MHEHKKTGSAAAAMIVTAVVGVAAAIWLGIGAWGSPKAVQKVDTTAGLTYLGVDSAGNPAEVDKVLEQIAEESRQAEEEKRKNQARDELKAEYEEKIRAIQAGETDVWAEFQDYVILGDSRAVGFWYFDFLDKNRCLSDGGHTIRNIADQIPAIQQLDPKYLIFCYGLNDTSIGYWDTPEEYAEEFRTILQDLQQRLPDTTMVVSSILPARDPAFKRAKAWYKIPDFSAAVGKMCQEEHIVFIENQDICDAHADLWQPDGIHVRPEFYPHWGRNMIEGILRDEMERALA